MKIVPRIPATLAAVLATGAVAVAAPAAFASDPSGGAEYGSAVAPSSSPAGGTVFATPVSEVGTSALHARPDGMLGRTMHFRGSAPAGRTVAIQRLDPRGGIWVTEATARADAHGDYLARWRPDHIGVFSMRALPATRGARASQAPAAIRITVFKPALATWYGPGFYGQRTACGQTLTPDLVGVAHRGLPCGRMVALYYKGRTLMAPVVDRGPYGASGASYDLTAGAARALGFQATGRLGAVSLAAAGR